jgi:hypothetical protein
MRMNARAGFFTHHFTDADPVIEFVRWNNRQDGNAPPGMGSAHRGKPHRIQTFAAVV